mgnify:CR=1 FL=1
MNSYEEFFKLPGWQEFILQVRHEIAQVHRPADQIILDDVDLCNLLKLSKRTTAELRAQRQIVFYKCGGRILYKLSDALDYIDRNRIELGSPIKSKIK